MLCHTQLSHLFIMHHWTEQLLIPTESGERQGSQFQHRLHLCKRTRTWGQEDLTLLPMVAARDHSPQKVAAPVCDAGLWWVLGAALKDLITEIKEHLPLISLIKKVVFNLSCSVLKSGVLSNSISCTSQVVQLH